VLFKRVRTQLAAAKAEQERKQREAEEAEQARLREQEASQVRHPKHACFQSRSQGPRGSCSQHLPSPSPSPASSTWQLAHQRVPPHVEVLAAAASRAPELQLEKPIWATKGEERKGARSSSDSRCIAQAKLVSEAQVELPEVVAREWVAAVVWLAGWARAGVHDGTALQHSATAAVLSHFCHGRQQKRAQQPTPTARAALPPIVETIARLARARYTLRFFAAAVRPSPPQSTGQCARGRLTRGRGPASRLNSNGIPCMAGGPQQQAQPLA
jgi:hypothetical protein